LQDEEVVTTKHGFRMYTDPQDENIRAVLKRDGEWEPEGTKTALEQFRGGTFVDVGAHWGYYSLLLAKQVDRVYALEPNPRTFGYLTRNVELNRFENVFPMRIAAWDRSVELSTPVKLSSNTGGAGVGEDNGGEGFVGNVWGQRLDTLLKPEEVTHIKVDCEGSDGKVLRGAQRILEYGNPKVMAESAPQDYLMSFGYKQTWMSNNGGQGVTALWTR